MSRLIIIVEGDTEKEFVKTMLLPFFIEKGFYSVDCFKVKHSRGGLSKYEHVKKDLLNTVYETDAVVTTLFDFYALPTDFPKFKDSIKIKDKNERLNFLEKAIKDDIELSQSRRFDNLLPYLQLHEFETLIFSAITGIKALFESTEADFDELNKIIASFPNPEDINDNPNKAPSKRLSKCIQGYNKVLDGVAILDEIGLEKIRSKCSRFDGWLNKVSQKNHG